MTNPGHSTKCNGVGPVSETGTHGITLSPLAVLYRSNTQVLITRIYGVGKK